MDYNRIVQEILNIGEELLKSGAEIFRVEDSLYRMCRSYGFVRSDVYASQINIQMTVETPEGEIILKLRVLIMINWISLITCPDMFVPILRNKQRFMNVMKKLQKVKYLHFHLWC